MKNYIDKLVKEQVAKFEEVDAQLNQARAERIERLNNNIEFYNGQLEKLKRSGYSGNHNLIVKLTDSLEDEIKLLDEFKVKYEEI